LVFPALVLIAAFKDATSYTIPNWISVAAALAYVPCALLAGAPLGVILTAIGVGAAVLVAGMAFFLFGWVGGGDAKLLAVCALWLGWPVILPFLFWTALAGGALALALLWSRSVARYYPAAGPTWLAELMKPNAAVPYGVSIAIGALVVFPACPLLNHAVHAGLAGA
jgi:prepilin peptidase CpaA